jgi:hypothetical protein
MCKFVHAILLSLLLLLGPDSAAQPVAEGPELRTGDSWKFRRHGPKDGEFAIFSGAVEAIHSPDRIAIKWEHGKTYYYDAALNIYLWERSDWPRVLAKYPLRVGAGWTSSLTFTNPNWGETGQGKVVAYEMLDVPAGKYQCYRVEAESTYGSKYYTEYRVWTRWYCPEVKWFAKQILMTRTTSVANPAADATSTETWELVEFIRGRD